MKKYFYFLFVLFFIVNSCKEDSKIIVPIDSDYELQKQIIGTWQMQSGTRTITYRPDFTFIDSSISFIAQGTYSIEDSILFKSNIIIRYIDPSYYPNPGYNFIFPSKYLKFSNNIMTEIPVNVLVPNDGGNNSVLWGSWSRVEWIYLLRYSEPSYLGRIKIVNNFDETNKKAYWWSVYLDRTYNSLSDTLWSNNVIYNPPILDMLGTGDYLVEVLFKNNKLYWWEPYVPDQYIRLN